MTDHTKDLDKYRPYRASGRVRPPLYCRGCKMYIGRLTWPEFYNHVERCPSPWDSVSKDVIGKVGEDGTSP